jgi:hypothetical protein
VFTLEKKLRGVETISGVLFFHALPWLVLLWKNSEVWTSFKEHISYSIQNGYSNEINYLNKKKCVHKCVENNTISPTPHLLEITWRFLQIIVILLSLYILMSGLRRYRIPLLSIIIASDYYQ